MNCSCSCGPHKPLSPLTASPSLSDCTTPPQAMANAGKQQAAAPAQAAYNFDLVDDDEVAASPLPAPKPKVRRDGWEGTSGRG